MIPPPERRSNGLPATFRHALAYSGPACVIKHNLGTAFALPNSVRFTHNSGKTEEAEITTNPDKPNLVFPRTAETISSEAQSRRSKSQQRWAEVGRAICFAINRRQLEREGFQLHREHGEHLSNATHITSRSLTGG